MALKLPKPAGIEKWWPLSEEPIPRRREGGIPVLDITLKRAIPLGQLEGVLNEFHLGEDKLDVLGATTSGLLYGSGSGAEYVSRFSSMTIARYEAAIVVSLRTSAEEALVARSRGLLRLDKDAKFEVVLEPYDEENPTVPSLVHQVLKEVRGAQRIPSCVAPTILSSGILKVPGTYLCQKH